MVGVDLPLIPVRNQEIALAPLAFDRFEKGHHLRSKYVGMPIA
jgi:hypothetical protein